MMQCIMITRAMIYMYINECDQCTKGRRGRNRMVVGFTATYATSAYHH